MILKFPRRRYGTLVIDPPWRFRNTQTRAAARRHYQTMSAEELAALPVPTLARANSHLYMWTTAAHLKLALSLIERWGFEYKFSLVWVKTKSLLTVVEPSGRSRIRALKPSVKLQLGLGNYYRHAHEICLFAVRGAYSVRSHSLPTVLFAPRLAHSAKPPQLQAMAEALSTGPRIELFARASRPGWDRWGREAPRNHVNRGCRPEHPRTTKAAA